MFCDEKVRTETAERERSRDADRFALAVSQVAGKRLTYGELTGRDTDTLHTPPTGTGETPVPF